MTTTLRARATMLVAACPVCFGAADGPLASAANAGIFVLLAVTIVVLAGIGGAIVSIARRTKIVSRMAGAVEPTQRRPEEA